jgi:MtN3 and saliva related transmembrane protein
LSQLIADAVGVGAALCSMSSFAPQIAKIWRERDASSVSLRMYLVTVTGFSLWIAYGALIGSWPVAVSNIICLAMSGCVLILKWRFNRVQRISAQSPRRSQP